MRWRFQSRWHKAGIVDEYVDGSKLLGERCQRLACCLTIAYVEAECRDGYVVFCNERRTESFKFFGIAAIEDERVSFCGIFSRASFADAGRCASYEYSHGYVCVYMLVTSSSCMGRKES